MYGQFNDAAYGELFVKPDDEHPAMVLAPSPALEWIETVADHGNNISISPHA